ncbi:hypothetical protein ACHAPT_005647 [Fusarium lateritium]
MAGTMHSGRYQQAAQQSEDDLGYMQHPMDGYLDGPTWTTYTQSPTSGRQGQHYDQLAQSRNVDSVSPRPVSPLRPSEEYERCVPSQEPSPVQPIVDPKYNTRVQYTDQSPPAKGQDGLRQHMWTPMWLSKTVLLIFALAFVCMMLATGLLYHFSKANNGISTQKETNHYGWKYGPTALLVVVGALWKQVDHHNKMLVPWKELQQGPAPADKSLLLDYVSPLVPNALWKAIKNRHWAVALSIAGHLLILGTTVFSTGLLILEPTEVTKANEDFAVKSEFRVKDPKDVDLAFKVGPAAAQLYYGIHFQGLQYPAGTSENLILPELQLPNGVSDDLNYTLTTEGIRVDLDCEILPVTNGTVARMPWKSILGSFIVANVSTPNCKIDGITIGVSPDHNYYHRKNTTQNYQGLFGVYPCNVDWNFAGYLNDTETSDKIRDVYADQRVVMSVADLRVAPYNVSTTNPDYFYVQEVKMALCRPSYNLQFFDVQAASLVNNSAQAVLSSVSKSGRKLVSGLPVGAVARGVEAASKALYLGPGGEDYALSQVVPTFFQLMSMKNGNSSVGAFLDPDLLIETGTNVFNGIAAQLMRQLALQPIERKVAGNVSYVENRLHVKAQSTGFMCGFLGLLTLIAVGTIFLRPRDVLPHEPGSAATMAAILAASHSLRQTLMNMGSLRHSQIRSRLQGLSFRSVVVPGPEPAFVVEPVTQSKEQASYQASAETGKDVVPWWWPMAGTRWFLCVTIMLPLLLIAALEIVQRISDANTGFVNIGSADSIVLATYIPAAVVLGVASMYSAVEFMVAVFAPFHALRKGKAPAERSIGLNMVGKLLPLAALTSFKTRHFAVLVALLANFIGSFLTIVISGLYTAINVPEVQNMAIQQLDTFSFNNVDLSVVDNQAAAIDSLIEYLDLDYPQWTHEGLVYNHYKPPPMSVKNASTEMPLTINVPAYRPKLNCTPVVEERQIGILMADAKAEYTQGIAGQNGFTQVMKGYMQVGVNTTLDYAKYCETPPNKNRTEGWWLQTFLMPYTTAPVYLGQSSVMQWGVDSIVGNGPINTNPTTGDGYGANGLETGDHGCPTFTLTLGTVQVKGMEQIGKNETVWDLEYDLGTIMCYQNIERVETNVTWSLPDFQFTSDGKPQVDESTATLVRNGTGSERYEFAINAWLEGLSDSVYNRTVQGPNNSSPAYANIDQFVSALVYGKAGRPIEELLGEKGKDKLAEGASRLYEVYMAQAMSLNMRSNSTDSARLPSYNGTLTTSGHRRLKQNKPTKIALQAMLATMAVLAIATTQLMEVRGVLPHNPCSIAGTATLLAGGEMTTPEFVPPGSEWRNDRELVQSGVFNRSAYTLKWWNTTDSHVAEKQRYGVDVDRSIG